MKTKYDLKPNEVDCIIYHNPCADGTGSALVFYKYVKENKPNLINNVKFYPANHGALPPDVTGKNVLICDFSYKKPILIDMINKANKLLVIDHHISASKDLSDISEKYKIFDMKHSGAVLTWNYFYPNVEPPLLLKYIEDRDIWANKLEKTNQFVAWFYNLPLELETYEEYLDDNKLLNMIETKGSHFYELNEINIKSISKYACPVFSKIKNKYYIIGYLNTNVLKSDIGNRIFEVLPYIDFSAVYSINDHNNTTCFSLRSTCVNTDISKVAFSLGGGGHRNASGVKVDYVTNRLPSVQYDSWSIYNSLEHIEFKDLVVRDNTWKTVYINSCVKKDKLAKYLLQTKFVTKHGIKIQEAVYVDAIRSGYSGNDLTNYFESVDMEDKKIDIAIIWYYDCYQNKTIYNIVFHKSIKSYADEIKKYLGYSGEILVKLGSNIYL